jgi:peptide/nickel transport system ATP-binding protein
MTASPTSDVAGTGKAEPFAKVSDLTIKFVSKDASVSVVNGVDFELMKGETLCLLGESGSGKSVTLRGLTRLLPSTAQFGGRVVIDGVDVLSMPDHQLPDIRGVLVAMIFQEPMTALDPVFTVGQQIVETVRYHERVSYDAARKRALELFEQVQIPSAARRLDAYPHELSGGLRQRAMIALALSCRPKLLLADEPTTALDATVQIQVLSLLRDLQRDLGMTMIIVTHDLGVACEVADRVAVMYAGRFVETGTVEDILLRPTHPYTQGLLHSTVHGGLRGQALQTIPGAPPSLTRLPPGCSFAPRCGEARVVCIEQVPDFVAGSATQSASCFRYTGASFSNAAKLVAV